MKELTNSNNKSESEQSKELLEDFFENIEAMDDLGATATTYSAVDNLVEDRFRRREPWALICPMD